MTIYVPYTIECDKCGKLENFKVLTLHQAMKEAENLGWKTRLAQKNKPAEHICPECFKKGNRLFNE